MRRKTRHMPCSCALIIFRSFSTIVIGDIRAVEGESAARTTLTTRGSFLRSGSGFCGPR